MDAKPQRARNPRVPGNENLPPYQNKTIHHRNKSSPALSTSAAMGGLKVAPKRTAFGDVSNTANGTKQSKDDFVVPIKEKPIAPERQSVIVQEKKAPALSKPAQRTGVRNLWTSSTATAGNDNQTNRSYTTESNTISQTANSRKTLKKRSTTIFKDSDVPAAPADLLPKTSAAQLAPLSEILNLAPLHKASEEPEKRKGESIPVPTAESNVKDASNSQKDSLALQRQEETKFDNTKQGGNDSASWQLPRLPSLAQLCQPPIRPSDIVGPPSSNNVNVQVDVKYPGTVAAPNVLSSRYSQVLPSESEEYWDEEDDENYAEDGYITARSIRSRGGDTTGAATTVLFPRCTRSVQRELAAAKQQVEATRTREDYEDEAFDTTMVAEYGEEIFTYMKELQTKMLPNAHYMDNQAEITWSMRSVLMDWLVQVHHRFGLLPETLFLAVNYIDRFLSCKVVSINKLQLVGATAIFIAAKYEEINCPSVQEIVYMVDGGYSVDEILKAERFMLSMLQFELGWPGPMSFLRRISKADDYDLETRTLAKYFLEVTVMDERFVGCPPSFTSAGAHCLARMILRKGTWSPSHIYYSDHTYSQLFPLLQLMLECCERPHKHHAAVFDKYCDKRFKRASIFVETEVANGFRLSPPVSATSLLSLSSLGSSQSQSQRRDSCGGAGEDRCHLQGHQQQQQQYHHPSLQQPLVIDPAVVPAAAMYLDCFDTSAWLHYA